VWARRAPSARRAANGSGKIKRDTYNSHNGMSTKDGWWVTRKIIEQRSGNRCEALIAGKRCGAKGVEVHHIVSLSRGGTNSPANLIMLCKDCHDRRHNHLFRVRR
jgi:5-methylcytosine-specific restriction endonuclease McrA